MKNMLRFFPALLAVWPYGLLAIALFEEGSAGSVVFFWVYCALTAALVLFQILYCCLHRASARTFAFWDLTVKLCHIPFYLAVFALGVLHLFFVFDVIGAAVEYAFFRAADSKNKLQQEGIKS